VILIAEDAWLGALFSDSTRTGADSLRCSTKRRRITALHVASLLGAVVSVVLDLPANTVETRTWMRGILEETGAAHRLHVLSTPDADCLARLRERNAAGEHPFAVTEEQFGRFSDHFAPPSPEEGFTVVTHGAGI